MVAVTAARNSTHQQGCKRLKLMIVPLGRLEEGNSGKGLMCVWGRGGGGKKSFDGCCFGNSTSGSSGVLLPGKSRLHVGWDLGAACWNPPPCQTCCPDP